MEEEIREHYHDPVAPIIGRRVPKDALPDLRVANVVAESHKNISDFEIKQGEPGVSAPGFDFVLKLRLSPIDQQAAQALITTNEFGSFH